MGWNGWGRWLCVRRLLAGVLVLGVSVAGVCRASERPNIVFAIADDWGWPHASIYGNDEVCQTPTFDGIARQGVLFNQAYVASPSCTASRNAILTGQYPWRLGTGANLWSVLDTRHKTYPLLLEDAGYHVGSWRKSWGPGNRDNWDRHPAGKAYRSPEAFFAAWDRTQPFCFWLGSPDPHRPYEAGSGEASGMEIAKIKLFAHFPDHDVVRSDVADYYWEVERFDREVGEVLDQLAQLGVLDNTLVVMTGDHGMPFPRGKANLYDAGVRVPLALQWPAGIPHPGRSIDDFVSTTDLAVTLLALAGVETPPEMTGRSWENLLQSDKSGEIDASRSYVLTGKERHVMAQERPDVGGTPMRAIRTRAHLLIRNFRPDRWPAGTPHHERATIPGVWLGDCDNGPTKTFLVQQRDQSEEVRRSYELAFGKRPEWELYDLTRDPGQLRNVAEEEAYAEVLQELQTQLEAELLATADPRVRGDGEQAFEQSPYLGAGPRFSK